MTRPTPPSTQAQHPWRATLRTVAAALVALLPLLPVVVDQLGLGAVPVLGGVLAVAGAVTRMLAIPAVEAWLHRYLPWLAPQPSGGLR